MKVGILTFHRAHNYGAVLQCYALQEVIKSLGHDVEIIDYRQQHIESIYRFNLRKSKLIKNICSVNFNAIYDYIKEDIIKQYRRVLSFKNFSRKYLFLSKPIKEDDVLCNYDIIIIGSDQMWSYDCTRRYEKLYWGNIKTRGLTQIVGYSISAPADFDSYIDKNDLIENLNNFTKLSVRESDIQCILKNKYNYDAEVTLDPTLLTNPQTWETVVNNKWRNRRYVAVYELRLPRNERNFVVQKAKDYAKANNMDCIDLSNMSYSVQDFISIIKYAHGVFTTSFHAVAFSIIFSTPLYAFDLHDGKEIRYTNLLRSIGCDNCIVTEQSTVDKFYIVDRDSMKKQLNTHQQNSIDFLKNVLIK